MYLETNLHLFFLPEEFLYEIAKMHESKPVFLMEGRALSFMLSLISPMLRFIQKSVIWFALQNLWQVSTWNTTLDWNGLTWKWLSGTDIYLACYSMQVSPWFFPMYLQKMLCKLNKNERKITSLSTIPCSIFYISQII